MENKSIKAIVIDPLSGYKTDCLSALFPSLLTFKALFSDLEHGSKNDLVEASILEAIIARTNFHDHK